jgi:hypothetical protein
MKIIRFALFGLFILIAQTSILYAQEVSKLIITDNLAASNKFGYGKPKPSPPKEVFTLIEDKGTQVVFFADVVPSTDLPDKYTLKFTAYKTDSGKDEWVDDREMEMKKTSAYTVIAFNFFEAGHYKMIISSGITQKQLAQGTFTIEK